MFCAFLRDDEAWRSVLMHPVWQASLVWLSENAQSAGLGDYPLGEAGWFANVHTYQTRAESGCIWESHAHTVDVQYMINGQESIRWLPTRLLGQPLRKLADRDRLEWASPSVPSTLLQMSNDMFAVFLPGEGHCPMIAVDAPMHIRKAVVKIPVYLLES